MGPYRKPSPPEREDREEEQEPVVGDYDISIFFLVAMLALLPIITILGVIFR